MTRLRVVFIALSVSVSSAMQIRGRFITIPTHNAASRALDHCYTARDVDIGDSHFASKQLPYELCCDQCLEDERCVAWSWTEFQNGTCWLKERVTKLSINPGGYAGIMVPLAKPYYYRAPDCDMPGRDIAVRRGEAYTDCIPLCSEEPQCRAFTWSQYGGGTCWLKSGVRECVRVRGLVTGILFTNR